ncbi:MAG: bifunctional glutamate N-acetyltransferase/amino-acid acetyltransferase ArgJ [Acidimicrobiaceae bacterium]|nr:bifunctional glutamate N-acetyltransferase/amino-acid acetyltransferase ArgJ [Acidimicrobiaceae bacterium]
MKVNKISPLAPAAFPLLPEVKGVRLATVAAGIRYSGCDDLMLAAFDPGTTVAGIFTRSLCSAAPIDWCRYALEHSGGRVRALICNTGNANAFTGAAGYAVTQQTAESVAAALNAKPEEVLVASTGVIAEPLDVNRIRAALPDLVAGLSKPLPQVWEAAAMAIGTTDTFPKGAARTVKDGNIRIAGFAKGSGMIAPDMATMLAFVFTDMALNAETARTFLAAAVKKSFNRITVDSDTSTSDMALLFSTGEALEIEATRSAETTAADEATRKTRQGNNELHADAFKEALDGVTLDLAHQIVRDGEGATKFVAITVGGATNDQAAEIIARAIADSPLVKTALAAEDANWGRIVAAVGKAGQQADRDRLAIWIGDEQCAEAGMVKPGYSEKRATVHLQGSDVEIKVDVGVGSGEATVWTCDLTHAYIDINAGYRS